MAGDRQTPSGSGFDPSPQFWVNEVEAVKPVVVTGRCYFGPLAVGTVLDQIAEVVAGNWQVTEQCHLIVEEIEFSGRLIDQVDQMCSARLVLRGSRPASIGSGSLLVASDASEAAQWHLEPDGLFHRGKRTRRTSS